MAKNGQDSKDRRDPALANEYLTATEAMEFLGVSAQTLYAYVSRKGIRSRPIPGTRQRRYWKADIEQLRQKKARVGIVHPDTKPESEITLITDNAHFYRGHSAAELAENASFETVAALLWEADEEQTFTDTPPRAPALWPRLDKLLAEESDVNRATALFPFLEEANPKAYDLSRAGMARTGADILRWLAAISVHAAKPTAEPIHLFFARELKLRPPEAELVRRMLVLSADHGFEPGALAVRAVASTGVTPWRSVITGLSAALGRKSKLANFDSISRFVGEITASSDPRAVVIRRMRESDSLPGFDSSAYPSGDPRARTLLSYCEDVFGSSDTAFRRLKEALHTVKETNHLEPNFPLACIFAATKLGLGPGHSLFHVGRAAGWIAHAIEQYQIGESRRERGLYKGPLP
jgi:citrate synthase